MRRIAPLATIVLMLVLGFGLGVLTARSDDANSPDWLHPLVDDGRASLLDRLDLVEPGTPLAFVGARCRSDGAVVLFYANRFLWVFERAYYAQTAPPYPGPEGFSGGVLAGPIETDLELRDEVWLAGHRLVGCAREPFAAGSRRGEGAQIRLPILRDVAPDVGADRGRRPGAGRGEQRLLEGMTRSVRFDH